MEEKKVYVLTHSWQFDSGECGQDIGVFATKERAKRAMKELIKEARIDAPDYVEDKYPDSYSRYEDGEYCYNHIDIAITECVVG